MINFHNFGIRLSFCFIADRVGPCRENVQNSPKCRFV